MIHPPDVIGKYAPDAVIGVLGSGGGAAAAAAAGAAPAVGGAAAPQGVMLLEERPFDKAAWMKTRAMGFGAAVVGFGLTATHMTPGLIAVAAYTMYANFLG